MIRNDRIAPLVAGAVTFLVFLPSLWNGFVHWDDDLNFLQNEHYRGLGADNLRWMFTQFHMGHWQPLSWVTLAIDWAIWGMKPVGYHLTNVILHALSAAVFAGVASRVFSEARRGRATDPGVAAWFGAAVALFWSLHPLRVEAVTWVTQRREVLCGFLTLLAALAHLRGRSRFVTGAFAILAMLAKVTAVTIPIVLVLIDAWRSADGSGFFRAVARAAKRHAALLVVAAGIVWIALSAQREARALVSLEVLPPVSRVAIYLYDAWFAVQKTMLPTGLAPLHQQHDPATWKLEPPVWVMAGLALVMIGVVIVGASRQRSRGALVLLATFLVLSAPAGGFTQAGPQIAAERYTYQPGWILALATGLLLALDASRRARMAFLRLGVVVLAVLATLSIRQQRFWSDTATLWRRELDVHPTNAMANYQLATFYLKHEPSSRALAEPLLRTATVSAPRYFEARTALAFLLQGSGRKDEAWREYQEILRTDPDEFMVIGLGGVLEWERGRKSEALDLYARLVRLHAGNPEAYRQLARAQAAAGKPGEAIATFERGIAAAPDPILWGDLAWLLATHPDQGIRDGRRALALAEQAAAREGRTIRMTNIMAAACSEAGDFERGLQEVEAAAIVLPPEQGPALDRLREGLRNRRPIRVEPVFP